MTPMLKRSVIAVAGVYGYMPPQIASAAWLWFSWKRDRNGNLVSYRWTWEV